MKRIVAVALFAALVGCKGPSREEKSEAALAANAANAANGSRYEVKEYDTELPMAFRGRWGLVQADCTSTNGDNKGLMAVEAHLEFSGEGQTWQQDTALTLEDQNHVLTRVADGQTLRYTRCGA